MKEIVKIDYDNERMIQTLKATVAKDATPEEFHLFVEYCRTTGLNPLKKEIWFIKPKSYRNKNGDLVNPPVQMMTGINGFLAIANSHPQFDGMICDVERDKDGKPIRAIAKVYRKDRTHPATGEAIFAEYYKPGNFGKESIWDKLPTVMIAKVAKSLALREAFPQELNGLYTEEEEEEAAQPEQTKNREEELETKIEEMQTKTLNAADFYTYNLAAASKEIPTKDRKKVWDSLVKKYGVRKENNMAISPVEMPEWEKFLISGPVDDDNPFRKAYESDELPEWLEDKKEVGNE